MAFTIGKKSHPVANRRSRRSTRALGAHAAAAALPDALPDALPPINAVAALTALQARIHAAPALAAPALAAPAAAAPDHRMTLEEYIEWILTIPEAIRIIMAEDMDSFENQTLLAGNDSDHDMAGGYRGEKGKIQPFAKTTFEHYFTKFLKKRYNPIINTECKKDINLLYFYSNCINYIPANRHITPSEVEAKTKSYFERSTTLRDKTMKMVTSYRAIVDMAGALDNPAWNAIDTYYIIQIEDPTNEFSALIENPMNRQYISLFIERYLYGNISNQDFFITFDACQDRVEKILEGHERARRAIHPQTIHDAASTTTTQLGIKPTIAVFPINNIADGTYRSPYHYFSEEHAETTYRNRSFNLNTLYNFDYIIRYNSGGVNEEIICRYGDGITQGPSLNYLLELHLTADNSPPASVAHNFTHITTQPRQLQIGNIIGTSNPGVAQQIARDTKLTNAKPSALFLDIKRNGDYDQQKAAKISATMVGGANRRMIFSTGDILSGLKARTDGPEGEKINCITQLAGVITLYRMQNSDAAVAAAAAERAQYNRTLLQLYRNTLIGDTNCKQKIRTFMLSVIDFVQPNNTYPWHLHTFKRYDMFLYLHNFLSVNLNEAEYQELDNGAPDADYATQIDRIREVYATSDFSHDIMENIIHIFNVGENVLFNHESIYLPLNYEWSQYMNLLGREDAIDTLIQKLNGRRYRANPAHDQCLMPAMEYNDSIDTIINTFQSTHRINVMLSLTIKQQLDIINGKLTLLNDLNPRINIITQIKELTKKMQRQRSDLLPLLNDRNILNASSHNRLRIAIVNVIAPIRQAYVAAVAAMHVANNAAAVAAMHVANNAAAVAAMHVANNAVAAEVGNGDMALGGAVKRTQEWDASNSYTKIRRVNEKKSNVSKTSNPYLQYYVLKQICNQAAVYLRGMIVDTEQPIITLFIISIELKHLMNEMSHKNDGLVRYQASVIKKRYEKFNLKPISDQMNKILQHNGSWDKMMDELKGSIMNLDHSIGQLYTYDMRHQIIQKLVQESKIEPYSTTLKEMIQTMYLTWKLELFKNNETSDLFLQYLENITDELSILRIFLVLGLLDDNLDGSIEQHTSLLSDVYKYQAPRLQLSREIDNSSELLSQIMKQIQSDDLLFSEYIEQFNQHASNKIVNTLIHNNNAPANLRVPIQGGNRTRKHRGHKTQRKKHGARKTKSKRRFRTHRKKQNRK